MRYSWKHIIFITQLNEFVGEVLFRGPGMNFRLSHCAMTWRGSPFQCSQKYLPLSGSFPEIWLEKKDKTSRKCADQSTACVSVLQKSRIILCTALRHDTLLKGPLIFHSGERRRNLIRCQGVEKLQSLAIFGCRSTDMSACESAVKKQKKCPICFLFPRPIHSQCVLSAQSPTQHQHQQQ